MRAVDFGRYFTPKITLRLILESTNRRVYTVRGLKHRYRFIFYDIQRRYWCPPGEIIMLVIYHLRA